MEKLLNRFLNYVSIDTKSDTTTKTTPSTVGQTKFAHQLSDELKKIGLTDVKVDKNSYVTATLEANCDSPRPTIGFIAHLDTSPDFSGKEVKPRIVKNYDGNDIILNVAENIILKTSEFPELLLYKNQDIIVTDGTTLLGADDKAGIAEIITAMEYLIDNPEIKHGKIRICFTPDEEIGEGADHFDVPGFGADFAYTLDGGEIGELEFENFNAAMAVVTLYGRNVHPGYALNKMINSMHIASEFMNSLPAKEKPEHTSDYEGFFHLNSITGDVEKTELLYIIRDFDHNSFEERKKLMETKRDEIVARYGQGSIKLELRDQYYNMREKVEPLMHIIDLAKDAMKECGVPVKIVPIRGGTDGARLSYMGLPTPNIFAGGHNFHGRFEFVPVQSMQKAVDVIVKICEKT